MNYIEFAITSQKVMKEDESGLYIAELGDMGFESFREEGRTLFGYITKDEYLRNSADVDAYLAALGPDVERKEIVKENWNAVWESNFEPIALGGRCVVRAPFHEPSGADVEVVIMPKMSFGTGHHETTRMMMEAILDENVTDVRCLDMGSGTAVLAILAAMRGAASVDAVDIDEWAYENGLENVTANGVGDRVNLFCGNASLLGGKKYGLILANINRNILLDDISRYCNVLTENGRIFISGFLEDDIEALSQEAARNGLTHYGTGAEERWRMLKFRKGQN